MSTKTTILTYIIWALLCLSCTHVYGQGFQLQVEPVYIPTLKNSGSITHQDVHLDLHGMSAYFESTTYPKLYIADQAWIDVQTTSIVSSHTQLITLSSGAPILQEFPSHHVGSYIGKSDAGDFSFLQFGDISPIGYFSIGNSIIDLKSPSNTGKDILYSNAQRVPRDNSLIGYCGVDHAPDIEASHADSKLNYKSGSTKVISITMILDHAYVGSNGGKEAAIAKALGVINAAQVNFQDEFVSNINFQVNDLLISDCEECDPWSSTDDAAALLLEVNEWTHGQSYLHKNNMIVFWTGRDLAADVIGSSHNASLCSDVNTTVLQDVSDSPWQLRVLAAHEIGHALSSNHDVNSTTIMAPALNNSSTWSAGSKSAINTFLQSSYCLVDEIPSCPGVHDISAITSDGQLHINWTGASFIYKVEVIEMSSGHKIYNAEVEGLETHLSGTAPCEEYLIRITPQCESGKSLSGQLIYTNYRKANITMVSASPSGCYIAAGSTFYELDILLNNTLGDNQSIIVTVGDMEIPLVAFPGTHNYNIVGLPATGVKTDVWLRGQADDYFTCADAYIIDAPSVDCALSYSFDFNDCQLPDGWTVGVVESGAHSAYQWKVEDGDRSLLNYGSGQNANTSKTIDGTCMILIDDDVINTLSHSGTTWMRTNTIDLSDYDEAYVSFDYIFDDFEAKGDNDSELNVEVYNGQKWIKLWSAQDGQCSWYNIWSTNCVSQVQLNLMPYLNDGLQLRWTYTDGNQGSWSGMAAIDNIQLNAARNVADPCAIEEYYIGGTVTPEETVPHARTVYVDVEVGNPIMTIEASETVIFQPGATVMDGTSISISIIPCTD